METFSKKYGLICAFALLKFLITLFLPNSGFDLQRDEYLYWDQGTHLAWGYLEVPPALGFLSYFSRLFGAVDAVWAVRFWGALLGGLTVFITGKMAYRLGGGLYAQALACCGILLSAYLRIHILFQANALDIFFSALICYELICFIAPPRGENTPVTQRAENIAEGQNKYLIYCGILAGLGFLGKYSVGFFYIGLFTGILLTPLRRLFWNRYFYFAALIALCIGAPNFWWQYERRFPLFHHFNELYDTQLQRLDSMAFLTGQILILFPVLLIWLSGLFYLLLSKKAAPFRLFAFAYLAEIMILTILHGKDYYALNAYPVLLAFGGLCLERISASARTFWLRPIFILTPVLLVWYIFPLAIPYAKPDNMAAACKKFQTLGLLKWEDGKDHELPQDYADMLGWKELTGKVAKAYYSCPPEVRQKLYIHCDNYGEAGAINFYGKKYGLPEAHSLNSSYILWAPARPDIEKVLLISEKRFNSSKSAHFKQVVYCDSVTNAYAREKGTQIMLLSAPDSFMISAFYAEGDSLKRLFKRNQ